MARPYDMMGKWPGNQRGVAAKNISLVRNKQHSINFLYQIDTSDSCPIPVSTDLRMFKDNVVIDLLVPMAGCFHAVVTYENQEIGNGEFDLIVLTGAVLFLPAHIPFAVLWFQDIRVKFRRIDKSPFSKICILP